MSRRRRFIPRWHRTANSHRGIAPGWGSTTICSGSQWVSKRWKTSFPISTKPSGFEGSYFAFVQRPPRADLQIADLNRTNRGADEFQNLAADGFDHPADLAIAPFADFDFDVRVFA